MTVALSVLAGALIAGWLLPRLFARVDLCRADPLALVVAWVLSLLGFLAAAPIGVVLLLLPGHGLPEGVAAAVSRCWIAVQHGTPPGWEALAGVVGAAVLIAIVLRLTLVGSRHVRRQRHARREQLAALRPAARPDPRAPATWWLPHERPLAFSIAGRPGTVVATDGLRTRLDPDAVAAVLAHERAHLRGRHHLLIALADVLAIALPWVPLLRQAPAALGELVELAADVEAVRDWGRDAVATALLTVTGHGAPGSALAMARDSVGVRLERLRMSTARPRRKSRALSCGVVGVSVASLPAVAGASLLSLALLICLAPA